MKGKFEKACREHNYPAIIFVILFVVFIFVPFTGFVLLNMIDELFNLTHTLSYLKCLYIGFGAIILRKTIFMGRQNDSQA